MPEEGISCLKHSEILRYEEIEEICRTMAGQGLKHIRVTGGEPLVRRDCPSLIAMLKKVPGIETVTITTNGILLEQQAEALVKAGIDGVNISLDTLDAEAYHVITRGGNLDQVKKGIYAMLQYPQVTTKINCVLRDHWKETAISIAALAKSNPLHVRFIEQMPLGQDNTVKARFQDQVLETLEKVYGAAGITGSPGGQGPSVYYQFQEFIGTVGFISAISHKFCQKCNRVRLTADGKLRPCLQSAETFDLKAILRSGDKTGLLEKIQQTIYQKPKEHHFETTQIETQSMSQIGG
jgi:cyclic pyranopterin phosphate synthase